jgi:3-hydroxyisobutyrate dehydrogenase
MDTTKQVGWIGTGVMGRSMCGHLIAAGHTALVYNRSPLKAAGLVQQGATLCRSIAELASKSDILFTMVGFPEEVEAVYFGEHGVLKQARPGSLLIDMGTTPPSLAIRIAQSASSLGLQSLDAPVSGGDIGAREARLSIMVGGDESAFGRALPYFEKMGKSIVYQGPSGCGQHTKLVNQTLIAANMVGLCEALLYAYRSGLEMERVLESVSSGAAGSWSLSNLGPRILKGDFQPGFFVDHIVKDLGIVLAEAARMQLSLPGLALAHQLYIALQAASHGQSGTQALVHALANLNHLPWPPLPHRSAG